MRLRRLEISNFRGIKRLDWRHIGKTQALVGPGDSGKSTILDAVERVLSPRWNLAFDDTDFWSLDVHSVIEIRATITELQDKFYADTKFGLHLQSYNAETGVAGAPTGAKDEQIAVVLELTVDSSLEPSWNILDAYGGKHHLRAQDREALGMLRVGSFTDQHFGWSKGSTLTRLTHSADEVGGVLAEAVRLARLSVSPEELKELDDAAKHVQKLGVELGVSLTEELKPHLDASSLTVSAGALALHTGPVPLRRSGLGTRRLLAVAMQRAGAARQGLTLVDEFEYGLEPHRIRQLIRALRGHPPASEAFADGQLILTTHSPVVISELNAEEISVTRSEADGSVTVVNLPQAVQYIIKRTPGALLARKIVVAEGPTEAGLMARLDEAWEEETNASFGYQGVAVADGEGGTQPAELAGHFAKLNYQTALLIDSDAKSGISKAGGAKVLAWPDGKCTEERLALDLPEAALRDMTSKAAEFSSKGPRSVRDALAAALDIDTDNLVPDAPGSWLDQVASEESYRLAFGDVAKRKGWFKSPAGGKYLGSQIVEHWKDIQDSPTHKIVTQLREFVHG